MVKLIISNLSSLELDVMDRLDFREYFEVCLSLPTQTYH